MIILLVSFTISTLIFALYILKLNKKSKLHFALRTIFNNIDDNYLVLNSKYKIIDFNSSLVIKFSKTYNIKRGKNFFELLKENNSTMKSVSKFNKTFNEVKANKTTSKFEGILQPNNKHIEYIVRIIPVLNSCNSIKGYIINLKDITEYKYSKSIIKKTQEKLISQEKLLSLGYLIGGISHISRTAIMSMSGGLEALTDLIEEYKDSIDDKSVLEEDHYEIAEDMEKWLDMSKEHLIKINKLLKTIKDQAIGNPSDLHEYFKINEFIERIQLLTDYELKLLRCDIQIKNEVDGEIIILGSMSNLIQVFHNLLLNSIHEYGDEGGKIILSILKKGSDILFSVKDFGNGIEEKLKNKIFKEMITTKGKNGTGLGLYVSYAIITGKLNGKIWFDSKLGESTIFYISIPMAYCDESNS
ncbi:MAG: PAS domain-containing sensor histidine kinase [Clostridiales bacterium]